MVAYKTIIVGTDFSDLARKSLASAVELAKTFAARRLHVVHVVQATAPLIHELLADPRGEQASNAARESAERMLEVVPIPEIEARVTREVRLGSPARELSLAADENHADLLVVASHGHSGLARLVLGSAAGTLIRIAHAPVLVVGERSPPTGRFERVLAAVDLSPISYTVLLNAVSVAGATGGTVRVLSRFEHPILMSNPDGLLPHYLSQEESDRLRERHKDAVGALVRRLPKTGARIEIEVLGRGPAAASILETASGAGADLIVLGTSGRNAWHRMIVGSTANHVLVKAPCPVLVVPHDARDLTRDEVLAARAVFETGS